jgi:glycine/D-amino acid oxidase-like deaminating enzyme
MSTARKTLLSAAASIATTGIAHMISDFGANDLLRPFGLARRRSSWPQNLAYLGAGVVLGGVGALLLAPSSGEETRARIAKRAKELGDAASKQVRSLEDHVRDEVEALHSREDNNQHSVRAEG